MNQLSETAIGKLVAADYRTATVFKKHQLDFCCQGGRTISEACQQNGVSIWPLLRELEEVMQAPQNEDTDFRGWPLDLLVDYIEKTHHRYVRRRSEEIPPLLEKLVRVHGERHSELALIASYFTDGLADLSRHMEKEEQDLFPLVRELAHGGQPGSPDPSPLANQLEQRLQSLEAEHSKEGERFRKIARLSNNYTPPRDGCQTYQVTLALLAEFEADLHKHIHLENNILFPAVRRLCEEMSSPVG